MSNGDQAEVRRATPAPWPRPRYPWDVALSDPQFTRDAYHRRVTQELGDQDQQVGTTQDGHPIYKKGDVNVIDYGKHGAYQRLQQVQGLPGMPQPVDVPLRTQFELADQHPTNPWNQFGDSYMFNPADGSLDARLKRAALTDHYYNQTHPVELARFQGLKTSDQILSAMANDVAALKDSNINKWAQLKSDVLGMSGEDLRKQGIDPKYVDLLKQMQRARETGYFTPPSGGSPPNPLQNVMTSGFWGTLLAGGANTLYDWLAKKENLTQLRSTLPQDQNKVDLELVDEVNNNPAGRWPKGVVDTARAVAAKAEERFGHDQDPYDPDVSKPIPEPGGPSQTAAPSPTPTVPPSPSPSPTPIGQATPSPTPKPFFERSPIEIPGMIGDWAMKHVFAGGPSIPPWQRQAPAPTPTPAPAPVRAGAAVPPANPSLEPTPGPTPPVILPERPRQPSQVERYYRAPETAPEERVGPGVPAEMQAGGFVSAPRIPTQAEIDQMPTGTVFHWHDNNRYVKT